MLNDLKGHRNISQFSAFCDNPFAIMMEYSLFDFNPFGENREVTTLEDFIHFVVNEYDFSSFSQLIPLCAKDIATGLDFLHKRNVAHRNLKLSNVLVSNVHYIAKEGQDLHKAFSEQPIVCKLADFGLSRSLQFQTQTLLQSQTESTFFGTPLFMAPELYLETLKNAKQADLLKCDIWSFGMVMYAMLNPNVISSYSNFELNIRLVHHISILFSIRGQAFPPSTPHFSLWTPHFPPSTSHFPPSTPHFPP